MEREEGDRRWFWSWLFGPGLRHIVNRWLLLHVSLGLGLAVVAPEPLDGAGGAFLLPLAGIFIGIAFAWAGNAHALLQTEEVEKVAGDRFRDWVYEYQVFVLILLVTLVCWGVAVLGVFDEVWPTPGRGVAYHGVGTVLYALASKSLQACWRAVKDTQHLLVTRKTAREKMRARGLMLEEGKIVQASDYERKNDEAVKTE